MVNMPYLFLHDSNTLFVCNKMDNNFQMIENFSKITPIFSHHKDHITCFAISEDKSFLVTGSKDTTLYIWNIKIQGKTIKLSKKPKHILRGHDDEITCISISADLDVCISGSNDTTAIIHTLNHGRFVRTIQHPNRCPIEKLLLTIEGSIILYSSRDNFLHLFTINGKLLYSENASDLVSSMIVTKDNKYLITGGKKVIIRFLHNLEILCIYTIDYSSKICQFSLSKDEQFIFTVLENGQIIVFVEDKTFSK